MTMTTDFDVIEFADALAGALGLPRSTAYHEHNADIRHIATPLGWAMIVKRDYSDRTASRVKVSAVFGERAKVCYDYALKGKEPGSITFDASRPIEKLAADVTRRLVGAADAFAVEVGKMATGEAAQRDALRARIATLKARFPAMQAHSYRNSADLRDLTWSATVYVSAKGSVDFKLTPEGFSIERVTFYADKEIGALEALIALVTGL